MKQKKNFIKRNAVAVLGFHDGNAGQIETWFEKTTGYRIDCFVLEANPPFKVDIAAENNKRVSHLTEFPSGGKFKGRPFIVSLDWINEIKKLGIHKVLPLTPDNKERMKQIEMCHKHGLELVSAVHPSVKILSGARILPGVWINAGCIIGYKAEIATGVIINTGTQIDHHNVLKTCCQVDPGVVTAGFVTLRECCHVHTGAIIINRIEIGKNTIIGAGAVVIKNIPANCTAVGVPATVVKRRKY